ncbi:MAG: hypothetical protein H0X28_08095 [Solirubrobacterales bacterium]|nr:hypothetical protein [Solirubrobacterales bacterium]
MGQLDKEVDVAWIAGDDRHRADATTLLGDRHELGVDRRDDVVGPAERFGAQCAGACSGRDTERHVDIDADGLDQAIDERVGVSLAGAYLGEDRDGNQERAVVELLKQLDVADK